jgi:hypothetical protein
MDKVCTVRDVNSYVFFQSKSNWSFDCRNMGKVCTVRNVDSYGFFQSNNNCLACHVCVLLSADYILKFVMFWDLLLDLI